MKNIRLYYSDAKEGKCDYKSVSSVETLCFEKAARAYNLCIFTLLCDLHVQMLLLVEKYGENGIDGGIRVTQWMRMSSLVDLSMLID